MISFDKLWPHSRYSFINVRVYWTRFGNYYLSKSFALFLYNYFDLNIIVLKWEISFYFRWNDNTSRIKVVDGFGLIWFLMFLIKGWRQSFLESIIYELSNLFDLKKNVFVLIHLYFVRMTVTVFISFYCKWMQFCVSLLLSLDSLYTS